MPYALLVVGVLAVGLGVAASARLIPSIGLSRWWGLSFAFIPGVVVGWTHVTAEPLALALAALGLSLAVTACQLRVGGPSASFSLLPP